MKIKVQLLCLILFVLVCLLIPINSINYIRDSKGTIKLSRIDRNSFLMKFGIFFTPGSYKNIFFKPDIYISPEYEYMTPFDEGCFEIAVEFRMDTILMYRGTHCKTNNLNKKFQLINLPNAFGELNWFVVQEDTTGKYLKLDCKSDFVK